MSDKTQKGGDRRVKENKKARVRYYTHEKEDFFGINAEHIRIDESYVYESRGFFRRIASFIAYRLIATPVAFLYTKLRFREKFIGKKKLKEFKHCGFFIYSNHTQPIADAFSPNILTFPKKNSIIISKANLAMPVLGRALRSLGGIPLPDNLRAARNFSKAVESRIKRGEAVTVYPEAQVWEFFTGIRDFPDSVLDLPVRCSSPIFTATRTYHKGKLGVYCKIYIDGPFLPDREAPAKEERERLKKILLQTMRERALNSDVDVIKYVKKDNAEG